MEPETTPISARDILQHPVFGDERCIRAIRVLELAAEVKRQRKEARSRQFASYGNGEIDKLSLPLLEKEYAYWCLALDTEPN